MKAKFIQLFLLTLICWGAITVCAQDGPDTLDYGGVERSFYVYVPSSLNADDVSYPLLIALHPAASSGLAMEILTGLDAIAEERGLVVVYPNTNAHSWNDQSTDDESMDDVGFIQALIHYMEESYHIDSDRVYLTGFGSGGLMAYRLACEIPDALDSVAIVGTHMWEANRTACSQFEATDSINVLILNGSENHLYKPETYDYVSVWDREPFKVLGMDDTLAVWTERNGCDTDAISEDANTLIYSTCNDDTRVVYYTVEGGGYNWPRIGDYTLNQFGVDASEIIGGFFAGDEDWNIPQAAPFEETPRTFTYYVPSSYDPEVPTPMVVLLHGRFDSGTNVAWYTDMSLVAEENGFIALYPDGLENPGAVFSDDMGWNFIRGLPGYSDFGPDDVAFLSSLIKDVSVDLNIDQQRIYVGGMSNGGYMVHHLACNDPEQYAAFASVAGSAYIGMFELCQTDTPVPMLIIHGTEDDNVYWDGRPYMSYSILQVANFWAFHNACAEEITVEDLPHLENSEGQVRVFTIGNCAGDSEVVLYAVIGGGHFWPGTSYEAPKVNRDIHASEVLWEFFSRHSLEDE